MVTKSPPALQKTCQAVTCWNPVVNKLWFVSFGLLYIYTNQLLHHVSLSEDKGVRRRCLIFTEETCGTEQTEPTRSLPSLHTAKLKGPSAHQLLLKTRAWDCRDVVSQNTPAWSHKAYHITCLISCDLSGMIGWWQLNQTGETSISSMTAQGGRKKRRQREKKEAGFQRKLRYLIKNPFM